MHLTLTAHFAFRCRKTSKEIRDSTELGQEGGKKVRQSSFYVGEDNRNRKLQSKGGVERLEESIINVFIRGGNAVA